MPTIAATSSTLAVRISSGKRAQLLGDQTQGFVDKQLVVILVNPAARAGGVGERHNDRSAASVVHDLSRADQL